MKVLSDAQVTAHLLSDVSRETLLSKYHPALVSALLLYEENPAVVPARTVQKSSTPNCDTTHLFMPCTAPHTVGFKVISGGSANSAQGLGFQGCVVTLDEYTGTPRSIVNGKLLTAFRTALATSVPLSKIVANGKLSSPQVTVFGSGPQAFWHVMIACRLYPDQITRVNVVSRSYDSALLMAEQLRAVLPSVNVEAFGSDSSEISEITRSSAIVFGCMPCTEPMIKLDFLNTDANFLQFVGLIGSYKPHMSELTSESMQLFKNSGCKVVVDSVDHCLAESGELIQNGFDRSNLVSITELGNTTGAKVITPSGLVLSKVVGLLIMDIAMANLLNQDISSAEVDF